MRYTWQTFHTHTVFSMFVDKCPSSTWGGLFHNWLFNTVLIQKNKMLAPFFISYKWEGNHWCDSIPQKSSSAGIYVVSSRLLKDVADLLDSPLAHIVNKSFENGKCPFSIKISTAKPLFKKGNMHDPVSYRPKSILSSFSNIFEQIVFNILSTFLE